MATPTHDGPAVEVGRPLSVDGQEKESGQQYVTWWQWSDDMEDESPNVRWEWCDVQDAELSLPPQTETEVSKTLAFQDAETTAVADPQTILQNALQEAKKVSEGVVEVLGSQSFRAEPPPQHMIMENALWLKERVEATDRLDSETPFTIVHWSVLESLGRLPRNPDDQQHFQRAADVINNYLAGKATTLLVICMISHRWRRPTVPHPDCEQNLKARALAKYGKSAARLRNVDMFYWLDYAGVNQDDLRHKIVGISKLPCIVATCSEFLVFWSDDYEDRAWTRMERFIGYVLSPCSNFKVIDGSFGKKVRMEDLTKTGTVAKPSMMANPVMKITDPLRGHLTASSDRAQLERLVEVGRMFPPMAYRGTASKVVDFNTSKIELLPMVGCNYAKLDKQGTAGCLQEMGLAKDSDSDVEFDRVKSLEQRATKHIREELVMGFGFTVKRFILYNILRSFMPLILNGAWVAMAGIGSCGMRQNFWVFSLQYDTYFMFVKGVMISAYYYCFMPPPTPEKKGHTLRLHILLATMMVSFNFGFSMLWWSVGLHDEGNLTWLLFKANFPLAASIAFVTFMPLYLRYNFQDGKRLFAFKRYILLTVVLVCDVIFIASSHAYIFFFQYAMDEWLPGLKHSFLLSNGLQAALIIGFTMIYMPVLGKIWWFGVLLVDKVAPMHDLQHQRFIYFATVICDMHRLMYARELFVSLDSYLLFYLILFKDFNYMIYQFGIKAHPLWQTMVIGIFHPQGLKQGGQAEGRLIMLAMKFIRIFAELMECPKQWLSWHRTIIDAGFQASGGAEVSTITFFCCDALMEIRNVPSAFSGEFAKLKDMPEAERRKKIKTWIQECNFGCAVEALKSLENKKKASEASTSTGTELKTVGVDELPHERDGQSMWDVKAAEAADRELEPMTAKTSSVSGASSAGSSVLSSDGPSRLPVTWEAEFYSYLTMRINGLIYLRAQARITISIASALSYIFMGMIIRSTDSKHVLNFVKDHGEPLKIKTIVAGISFLIVDALVMLLLTGFHMYKKQHRVFHLAKFGRLFHSKIYFAMLTVCTVCCNSDVYLTYPDMDFCT